jgi:heme oxygenase (biliverdin-IX-beta and delta-forming)
MEKHYSARRLFLQESFGILSTLSLDVPGYPFGSIVPYCADGTGRPVIYISHIAQHTKNVKADPRVSLTIVESHSGDDDVQSRGRLTVIGNATPIPRDDRRTAERYFRHVPESRQYDQTHDFAFYRIDLVRLRFIGGFGQIHWVEPGEFVIENPFSEGQETRILDHMNADHAAALTHYAGGKASIMTGIDSEGFDMLADGRKLRVHFDSPIRTMEEARAALVAMSRRS